MQKQELLTGIQLTLLELCYIQDAVTLHVNGDDRAGLSEVCFQGIMDAGGLYVTAEMVFDKYRCSKEDIVFYLGAGHAFLKDNENSSGKYDGVFPPMTLFGTTRDWQIITDLIVDDGLTISTAIVERVYSLVEY